MLYRKMCGFESRIRYTDEVSGHRVNDVPRLFASAPEQPHFRTGHNGAVPAQLAEEAAVDQKPGSVTLP